MATNPDQDEHRYRRYAKVYLQDDADLPPEEQLPILQKKLRNKWIHFAVNVVIILFFTYIFLNDAATLHRYFYYAIFGVFLLNIWMVLMQQRHLNELIRYVELKSGFR